MSATLRHDIPQVLKTAIGKRSDVLSTLGAYEAGRWAGVHRGYNKITTFAIKLPAQIGAGYELLKMLSLLCDIGTSGVHAPAWTLQRKLIVSFGLPYNEFFGQPCSDEQSFLTSIDKEPANIATWSAYSDWMVEHGDVRGTVIAEWLDPKKAVKTKYGIPVSVRHKLGRS
jgi:uncharacterized protein (TIGR02996 family)